MYVFLCAEHIMIGILAHTECLMGIFYYYSTSDVDYLTLLAILFVNSQLMCGQFYSILYILFNTSSTLSQTYHGMPLLV